MLSILVVQTRATAKHGAPVRQLSVWAVQVKAGQDQAAWESSGWINDQDPRGEARLCTCCPMNMEPHAPACPQS